MFVTKLRRFKTFLEKHKALFGMADFALSVHRSKTPSDRGAIATAEVDQYEKTLDVILYPPFFKRETNKLNVLLHELIHARIALMRLRTDARMASLVYEEEEDCVNDVTRGVFRFGHR